MFCAVCTWLLTIAAAFARFAVVTGSRDSSTFRGWQAVFGVDVLIRHDRRVDSTRRSGVIGCKRSGFRTRVEKAELCRQMRRRFRPRAGRGGRLTSETVLRLDRAGQLYTTCIPNGCIFINTLPSLCQSYSRERSNINQVPFHISDIFTCTSVDCDHFDPKSLSPN